MKRLTLIAFLCFVDIFSYAQSNTIIGIYGGTGLATSWNYNAGISGGFNFLKEIGARTYLGATLFYQGYNFLYDHEEYGAKNGTGNAGVTVLNQSGYIFLAPKLSHDLDKDGFWEVYVDAGPGFNMSGKETMRKWDHTEAVGFGYYDSTINTTKNINSLVVRVGVGLSENLHMGGKWRFTFTEDFGCLASELSKTADANNPSRTPYSPNRLNPDYFSVQIGISHNSLSSKDRRE
jgi:hypothetical protein